MKIVGTVLLILGIIGVVVFGIQAFNDSESFNVLGAEVAVSKANWTPLIVSALVLVAGIVLPMTKRKSD
ncbi:hypothetical protein [Sunxiuqinia indica]|jgi:hypothetical protein|uniref:hypothetical protein n=1 Tax=Sunxiuqinia indica TaxID=2692584 RepID=UPI00135AD876|nr:hypothetical protein [Sunxiuqinia indica]